MKTISKAELVSWLLLFYLTSGFSFPGYFTMPLALHPDFSDPWRFSLALIYTLAISLLLPDLFLLLLTFLFIICLNLLRDLHFWEGFFLPARVFNLTLLSHILTHVWLRLEQNDPAQDLPLYLLSESCPYRVAHDFELFIRKSIVL